MRRGRSCTPHDERATLFGMLLDVPKRMARRVDERMRERCGMPARTFEVMLRVDRGPGARLTISQLAEATGISSGGASRLADRLVAQGFLARSVDLDDRRVTFIELTPQGRDALTGAFSTYLTVLEELVVSRIGAEGVGLMLGLLRELREGSVAPEVIERSG